ncbi:FeoC-like transcriptional regulator [Tropicimonas sp. IMCC34043]|uniref:FeoC-like transcriptional regulator n=1 Tax=Tropicimonas sp. IMCC34043 TaxID=2248760 RepID=UPI000E2524CB|nr:FeoC-like transcriptional regulator [Tropicimonas sp. IMCC34043]
MLMELRAYLKEHGSASLSDLSNRFRLPPEAIEGMLDHWVRKGRVARKNLACVCPGCASSGGCAGCPTSGGSCCGGGISAAAFEIYEWLETPVTQKSLGSEGRAA